MAIRDVGEKFTCGVLCVTYFASSCISRLGFFVHEIKLLRFFLFFKTIGGWILYGDYY